MGRPAELAPVPLALAYPERSLMIEAAKGLTGTLGCLAVVFFLAPTPYLGWPIGLVGLLFLMYFLQQASRFYLRLRVDDIGILYDLGYRNKAIRWSELEDLKLHFYPQSKGARQGMLVLILKDGKRRIKLDSSVDHFPTLLARAVEAAREKNLELHPTTVENLQYLGL